MDEEGRRWQEAAGQAANDGRQGLRRLRKFRNEFVEAVKTQFGSGWAWLTVKDGKLKSPARRTAISRWTRRFALAPLDVWEHSYYIDYRNPRPKYLEAWFDNLVNWEHVEEMLDKAPK